LFRARRMDGDRVVEVALGRAHADRDRESLQHLVRAVADDVAADDLLLAAGRHELHGAAHLALREGVEERGELGTVDLHVFTVSAAGLTLRQADGADGGRAEDPRRYALVRELALGPAAEEPVREAASRRDRDRRQGFSPGHVADRVDTGGARVLPFVG